MASKPESPITLVVRRGALRRFHKLKKDTVNLPVVVTWDRRGADPDHSGESETLPPEAERRQQPSFTWDLADFIVVPGDEADAPLDAPGDPIVEPRPDAVPKK